MSSNKFASDEQVNALFNGEVVKFINGDRYELIEEVDPNATEPIPWYDRVGFWLAFIAIMEVITVAMLVLS